MTSSPPITNKESVDLFSRLPTEIIQLIGELSCKDQDLCFHWVKQGNILQLVVPMDPTRPFTSIITYTRSTLEREVPWAFPASIDRSILQQIIGASDYKCVLELNKFLKINSALWCLM